MIYASKMTRLQEDHAGASVRGLRSRRLCARVLIFYICVH
jgi:hypothetical protein